MIVVAFFSPFVYIFIATGVMLPALGLQHPFHGPEPHLRAILRLTLANEFTIMLVHGAVMTSMDLWRIFAKLFKRRRPATVEVVAIKSIKPSVKQSAQQTDLHAWKKQIRLTAVECQEKGVV